MTFRIYDKLCEDATAELDVTKRNTIIHDAEKLLVTDKAYVAPLATNKTICLLNPKYTVTHLIQPVRFFSSSSRQQNKR